MEIWDWESSLPNLKSGVVADSDASDSDFRPSPLRSTLLAGVSSIALKVQDAMPSYRGSLASLADQCLHESFADYCSFGEEANRLKETRRTLYTTLAALPEDDEEFGKRSWYVGNLLDSVDEDRVSAMRALSEVLLSSTSEIGEAARVAALRYASSSRAYYSSPEMLSLCFSSLHSDVEQQAIAAARTLGELGEPATLPQMRGTYDSVKWVRAKEALFNSVKEIEQSYGIDTSSS